MGPGAKGVGRDELPAEAAVTARIRDILGDQLGMAVSEIRADRLLVDYGLDSVRAVAVSAALARAFDRPVPATLLWACPTLAELARYFGGVAGSSRAAGSAAPQEEPAAPGDAVALIGIGCRFPGDADDPGAYFRLLCEGRDAIAEVPPERWDADQVDRASGGKIPRRGGFLRRVDGFDPLFFGISPREALQMDPQQRLMLELSWEALEDAGIAPDSLRESLTGVFYGVTFNDYGTTQHHAGLGAITCHSATGNALCIVANRVSYALGLQGPSLAVDTACSASLVAVHLACQSLLTGESDLALAGGVNLMNAPATAVWAARLGALSPGGRCMAFDARADGYVRGEGGGVVVLKRLSRAYRDGDRIYCVIRGSAVNNDGPSNGLTAPNPRAQERLLRQACRRARIEPQSVAYVEAHGTGTPLGDPLEADALGAVYGAGRPADRPLRIGSVKTNIGHLESAAGAAGLIKTALALHHRVLPPSLHFEQPNPRIDFDAYRLRVVTALEPWPEDGDAPARAGVSSFGVGGTNAHVILEAAAPPPVRVVPLSAASPEALRARAAELRARLSAAPPTAQLASLAGAAALVAGCGEHRAAASGTSGAQIAAALAALEKGECDPGADREEGREIDVPLRPVFVFSGLGSHWFGMGRRLLAEEPVFRAGVERCDALLREVEPWSILDEIFAERDRSRLTSIAEPPVFQTCVFALQMALVDLWRSWGVEPSVVIGHCSGELGAACAAGMLDLRTALHATYRMVSAFPSGGATLFAPVPLAEMQALLEGLGVEALVSCYNDPESSVVSGNDGDMRAVIHALEVRGASIKKLADKASHCPFVAPQAEVLRADLGWIRPQRGQVPMLSTVLGRPVEGPELDADYWAKNLKEPVRFAPCIERLAREGHRVFLEVSPHAILTRSIQTTLHRLGVKAVTLPSQLRGEDGQRTALRSLASLYTLGVQVRWSAVQPVAPEEEGHPPGPVGTAAPAEPGEPCLLILSAKTSGALREQAARHRRFLEGAAEPWPAIAAAGGRRALHDHRMAIVASDKPGAARLLGVFLAGEAAPGLIQGRAPVSQARRPVLIFNGHGSQWLGMGRALQQSEPAFAEVIERCHALMLREAGWSLRGELDADPQASRLEDVDVVQRVIFAIQAALTAALRALGIDPAATIGHSLGEVAAAHAAGALGLEDAVRIICARGRLVRELAGESGGLLAVEASPEEARVLAEPYGDRLVVGIVNGPRSSVLSGDEAALAGVARRLEAEGRFCRRVRIRFAAHSPALARVAEAMRRELHALRPVDGAIPFFSSLDGRFVRGSSLTADYWARNVVDPVRFDLAVQALARQGHDLFLEVGGHPVLGPAIAENLAHARVNGEVVETLERHRGDRSKLLESLGKLACTGAPLDARRLFALAPRLVVALPAYPWQRSAYWLPPGSAFGAAFAARIDPPTPTEPTEPERAPRELLGALPEEQRPAWLEVHVKSVAARVLGVATSLLDPDRSLHDYGLDSLLALNLARQIERDLDHRLPLSLLAGHASIRRLVAALLAGLVNRTPAAEAERGGAALVIAAPRAAPRLRLFCFPYAGGGARTFQGWHRGLPDEVEVCVFQPPGREERLDDAPHMGFADLLDEAVGALRSRLDRPFCFYGHSLGGVVAFEAARQLRREGLPLPVHLFIGAAPAPGEPFAAAFPDLADDEALLASLRALEGTAEAVLEHPEMRAIVLRVLRADLAVLRSHRHAPEPPLSCPITLFTGEEDRHVSPAGTEPWRAHTGAGFRRLSLPGGHFFLHTQQRELLALLTEGLTRPRQSQWAT